MSLYLLLTRSSMQGEKPFPGKFLFDIYISKKFFHFKGLPSSNKQLLTQEIPPYPLMSMPNLHGSIQKADFHSMLTPCNKMTLFRFKLPFQSHKIKEWKKMLIKRITARNPPPALSGCSKVSPSSKCFYNKTV